MVFQRLREGNGVCGMLVGIFKGSKGPTYGDGGGWSLILMFEIMEDLSATRF